MYSRNRGIRMPSASHARPSTDSTCLGPQHSLCHRRTGDVSNVEYKCIQAHTSQVGWEPPNVPALWQPVSGSPTPTPTPVPTATPTPTPAPTPTPTPGGTGGCSPTWVASQVYTLLGIKQASTESTTRPTSGRKTKAPQPITAEQAADNPGLRTVPALPPHPRQLLKQLPRPPRFHRAPVSLLHTLI